MLTGSTTTTRSAQRETRAWLREGIDRGAGEVVLNCMGSDGVRDGYDLEQLTSMRSDCTVPLIASGGAGKLEHFAAAFLDADVDGALAATVFHSGEIPIPTVKAHLRECGVAVRL
jgi:cyclase